MKDLADAAEELARQYDLLWADKLPRMLGASAGFLLAMGFVSIPKVAIALACYLFSEAMQPVIMRRLRTRLTLGRYVTGLANAALGACAFSFPALMLWMHPEDALHVAAIIYLTGALLNAAMVRATHLPHGITVATPPGLVLLYISLPSGLAAPPEELFTFATAIVLLAYFASALVVNHRMQTDLASARDNAEMASVAKSRFLSAISHDMRTPLNAIQGMGQMLAAKDAPADVRNSAEAINTAAVMLRTIVDDVLDFTASRDKALRLDPVVAPLRPDLDVVIAQHRAQFEAAGQYIHIEAEDLPELARVDSVRLRQCLRGMLVAANSAFGEGTLNLKTAVHSLADGRIAVEFDVTGPVCPGKTADEKDPQVALAATLARAMDGALDLRSRMNPTVTLRLTLDRVEGATESNLRGSGEKILIVDDIATNRLVIMQMLTHLGYRTEEASSGEAALLALESNLYDLVILDLNMPGMDGMATLRAIRGQNRPWAAIPVIGLTADAEAARRRDEFLKAGMSSIITKPVTTEVLRVEIGAATATKTAGKR